MKHLIAATVVFLLLFSCKKEINYSVKGDSNSKDLFFRNVKTQLKDSLSASDYISIDTAQLFKSKDAQSDGCFVRVAFQKKNLATDFILLKTDSLGKITDGKIIHVDKTHKGTKNDILFQGQFVTHSLNRTNTATKQVVNGRFKSTADNTAFMEEDPAGEQILPDVVVTSYSDDGGYSGDWYWYGGFFDDYGSSANYSYTYGNAGGGGSGGTNPAPTSDDDETINVEVERNDEPPVKAEDYIKCFSTVPDANAVYQVSIFADIPVDGDPSKMFDWSTGSVGHSFIQLTKTSGGLSVQQNLGFYPTASWKALAPHPCRGKLVDNGGHGYNASVTQTVNSEQFATVVSRIESLQANEYDIASWNCTDFALSVFNAATYKPLGIQTYYTEGSGEPVNTPQGLYDQIVLLQAAGNTSYGTTNVALSGKQVGNSHGSCQ